MRKDSVDVAAPSDIGALLDLYADFHAYHVEGVPDRLRLPMGEDAEHAERVHAALESILTAPDATVLVAKGDAHILGLAEVYLRRDEEHAAVVAHAYGYLQSLMVVADMRRRGIGTWLLHAAERWAVERGARELRLETREFAGGPAPFYEARGHRPLRRTWVRAW